MATADPRPWSVVVPVKRLSAAKSRLSTWPAPARRALALAFACDVVAAARDCPLVGVVLVVTDDPAAGPVLGGLGARVVPDQPDAGLNPALRFGATAAGADGPVAAVSADLPALRSAELQTALTAAAEWPRSFVCDASGIGTTLLTAQAGVDLDPRFGPRSRAAHTASGATDLRGLAVPGLRRDVDTEADLWDARRLGVGAWTARVLADR